MKAQPLQIDKLITERLLLIPFTLKICENIIDGDFDGLHEMGLRRGLGWPDEDVVETLPRIVNNLTKVAAPTGFESWMIVKRGTFEIIGDLGFKGYNAEGENVDIGYGIIKEERKKGYAAEAVTELMKWAFSQEIVKEITACCLPSNASSMGLLRKLNFTEIKREDEMVYWSICRQPA